MNDRNNLLRTAIAGVLALGTFSVVSPSFSADANANMEQCAGVVKAGKNDCATATNACHGHVESDGNAMAWIYVPKGTCDRIVGAHVVKVVDPTPKKTS